MSTKGTRQVKKSPKQKTARSARPTQDETDTIPVDPLINQTTKKRKKHKLNIQEEGIDFNNTESLQLLVKRVKKKTAIASNKDEESSEPQKKKAKTKTAVVIKNDIVSEPQKKNNKKTIVAVEEIIDEESEPKIKKKIKTHAAASKKTRYVLFVGRLPPNVTAIDLEEHFKKIVPVTSVRLPLFRDTNRPRGIAFIEVASEKDYQNALSLHHSSLHGHRINVEYTCAGSGKSKRRAATIKAKNLKFKALQETGVFPTFGCKKITNKKKKKKKNR